MHLQQPQHQVQKFNSNVNSNELAKTNNKYLKINKQEK